MADKRENGEKAVYIAGILAWLIPGAGHWYLGMRSRGGIMFVAICGTFLLGVLLGGIEMVDPEHSRAWFFAEILSGLPAVISTIVQNPQIEAGSGRGVDLGEVYAGVAGLLNLLCVLDAVQRSHLANRAEKTTAIKG